MKSPIVLPPFPNIRTWAVPSNLKEGRIRASVPACLSTCQCLQHKWPQMIAEKTILTVLPYWTMKFERNTKQLTFRDTDHKIESRSTITRRTSWLTSGSSQSDASTWPAELVPLANSSSPIQCPYWDATTLLLLSLIKVAMGTMGNLPYDCMKDTSKITHNIIIHEHESVHINHRVLYLRVWREHTQLKQSALPVTRVNTCTHRSSIFNK